MKAFIDTSAFIAILDADDNNHSRAKQEWLKLISSEANLISSNYILIETIAIVKKRLGITAVMAFHENILPVIDIEWIDETVHKIGISVLFSASRRKLSLVDCISFEIMRKLAIKNAFTFDSHFKEQGFHCFP